MKAAIRLQGGAGCAQQATPPGTKDGLPHRPQTATARARTRRRPDYCPGRDHEQAGRRRGQ